MFWSYSLSLGTGFVFMYEHMHRQLETIKCGDAGTFTFLILQVHMHVFFPKPPTWNQYIRTNRKCKVKILCHDMQWLARYHTLSSQKWWIICILHSHLYNINQKPLDLLFLFFLKKKESSLSDPLFSGNSPNFVLGGCAGAESGWRLWVLCLATGDYVFRSLLQSVWPTRWASNVERSPAKLNHEAQCQCPSHLSICTYCANPSLSNIFGTLAFLVWRSGKHQRIQSKMRSENGIEWLLSPSRSRSLQSTVLRSQTIRISGINLE